MPSNNTVGGGRLVLESASGELTHSLSSSSPLTITCPSDKILRLDSFSGSSSGVNVLVGSRLVVDGFTILKVGYSSDIGAIPEITGKVEGESIQITTLQSNSLQVVYSYSYLSRG